MLVNTHKRRGMRTSRSDISGECCVEWTLVSFQQWAGATLRLCPHLSILCISDFSPPCDETPDQSDLMGKRFIWILLLKDVGCRGGIDTEARL